MFIKRIISYLFVIISTSAQAAEKLDVIVGLSKPPYVLEDQQKGYELELVRTLLAKMDKRPNYIFVPFGRSEKMLKSEGIDALLTANPVIITDRALLSDVYITYQNVAISLASRNLCIETVEDLANYSITAFQNAHKILGETFAKSANESSMYTQVARQKVQVEMLLKGRTDTIVLDINIFNFFFKDYLDKHSPDQIKVHYIFPPSPYRMAFKNKAFVSQFNQSYAEYSKTNAYLALKKKYGLPN